MLEQRSYPAFTVLTSTPTLLTSISTVSPGFIHTGGLRRAPTPPGVPVKMTSPGSSVVKVELQFIAVPELAARDHPRAESAGAAEVLARSPLQRMALPLAHRGVAVAGIA